MTEPRRILVLEDDEDIASALSRGLAREGYQPVVAHDLAEARALAAAGPLTAAVIDVMLGEEDGKDMVRDLRAAGMRAPIVMLSALSGVAARAEGLEAGADDYVAKPFDFADLIARIQVQERRRAAAAPARLRFAGLAYDPERRLVERPGRAVTLTEREAVLLELFLRQPRDGAEPRHDLRHALGRRRRVERERGRRLYRLPPPQARADAGLRRRAAHAARPRLHPDANHGRA